MLANGARLLRNAGQKLPANFPVAIAVFMCLSAPITAHSALSFNWEVENRFRAFDFLPSEDEGASTFRAYAPGASERMLDWYRRVWRLGSPFAQHPGPWNEASGAYAKEYVLERAYSRIRAQADGRIFSAEEQCRWIVSTGPEVLAPCVQPVALRITSEGATVQVTSATDSSTPRYVKVKHRIIGGLGDSYGSGQGNPDQPTTWNAEVSRHMGLWDLRAAQASIRQPPKWWSPRCDRSFWSFQSLVALKAAAEDPHSTVTFVSFACAGAEIVDGLLAPQRNVPGRDARRCQRDSDTYEAACDAPASQIRRMVEALCDGKVVPAKIPDAYVQTSVIRYMPQQRNWITDLVSCDGKMPQLEALLISIGGNDVGFGPLVEWAIVPSSGRWFGGRMIVERGRTQAGVVCPSRSAAAEGCGSCPSDQLTSEERIAELPQRFQALAWALTELVQAKDPQRIALTTYPAPFRTTGDKLCADPAGANNNAWEAARALLRTEAPPFVRPRVWQFNIVQCEARHLESIISNKLNDAIRNSSGAYWRVADTERAFGLHGWCTPTANAYPGASDSAVDFDKRFQLKLPEPARAVTWEALSPRGRWLRTLNDSLLTQFSCGYEDSGLCGSEPLRKDVLSGAAHPTAEGHAAIADRVLETVLKFESPAN
jgi:hypothetical protein